MDTVSGATYSSTGILNAVKLALEKAAVAPAEKTAPEQTASEETAEETAPSEAAEPGETPVTAPTVEVVQPEEKSAVPVWLKEVWQQLFPADAPASSEPEPASSEEVLLRAVNLLLILGVLWQYQQVALIRAAAVSQRKQEIAEVEAYNASVLQAQSAAQAEQSGYRDGIYEGSAYGFGDVIRVSVTIQNGKMTDIAVLDASGEDKPYYKQALPLLDEMLAVQSAEVDTVSGATLTAEGLIGAVENALGKAAG